MKYLKLLSPVAPALMMLCAQGLFAQEGIDREQSMLERLFIRGMEEANKPITERKPTSELAVELAEHEKNFLHSRENNIKYIYTCKRLADAEIKAKDSLTVKVLYQKSDGSMYEHKVQSPSKPLAEYISVCELRENESLYNNLTLIKGLEVVH